MNRSQYIHSLLLRLFMVAALILLILVFSGCAYNPCNDRYISGVPGCEVKPQSHIDLKKQWAKENRWKRMGRI